MGTLEDDKTIDLEFLLGDFLGVNGEYISDLTLRMGQEGVINGREIYEEIIKEARLMDTYYGTCPPLFSWYKQLKMLI